MEGRELTVLPAIFQQLAAFNYNKAKDLAEKERSQVLSSSGAAGAVWPTILSCLAQLAAVERLYMNLSLLTTKGFLRRENSVRASYEGLLTELSDLETRVAAGGGIAAVLQHQAGTSRSLTVAGAFGALGSIGAAANRRSSEVVEKDPAQQNGSGALLHTLCSELLSFIRARICLIKFYETCHHCSSSGNTAVMDYGDLAATVADISSTYADNFTQPLLSSLHANLKHECSVLQCLLQTLASIQQHSFLPALLHLHAAHDALLYWQKLITCRESKKYSFGSSFLKGSSVPSLYQWLWQLRAAVNAKFSLFFYTSLASQTSLADMKTLLARQPMDYVAKLVSFHRRVEASSVCVVLESSAVTDYRGPGYHPPKCSTPALPAVAAGGGAKTFERIFCYPLLRGQTQQEAAQDVVCWSSLRQFLKPIDQLPLARDNVHQVYHHQTGYTHYLHPVEQFVTLAVSYDCHRTEKESVPVREFLNELSQYLNLSNLFAALKPR